MKTRILIVFCLLLASISLNAQTDTKIKSAKDFPVIKPTFVVSDVYVVLQILESIELSGNEIDAFIEVRDNLKSYLEIAKEKKLKVSDSMTVNMPGHIAQNTVTFLSRAKLKGNMVDDYKRFFDAIIEASKKL
jgi:hypothetical protein